ncbi:MAG TPA: hypothetical protein VK509_09795 [Polyangiales bacterium]|nr:hypothetical protein [Polyangiales bacterium]
MRFVGLVAMAGIGCAPPLSATEPTTTPGMSNDELDARLVGLRATLARSGIALDDVPTVESCSTTHFGNRCVHCDVARRDNTAGIEPSLIDSAAIAFAMYPPALLAATKVQHVALCRAIQVADGEMAPAGMALLDQQRILVSVGAFEQSAEGFTIDRVIHHELFHLLDYAGPHFEADREWIALNPRGFSYHDPEMLYRDRELETERPTGFVRSYATQNEVEDRASTFELVLAQPAELCAIAAKDPVVAKKVALIKKRVKKVAGNTPLLAACKPPRPTKKAPIDLRLRR